MNKMSGWQRNLFATAAESLSIKSWDCLSQLIPRSRRPRILGDKMHKLATVFRQPDQNSIYRRLVGQWEDPTIFLPVESKVNNDVWEIGNHLKDFAERMSFVDMLTYLPDDILTKVDRASMSFSLEVRVPLLDHRLVEFVWTLPKNMKIRGNTAKWLLRQVCYRHVPQKIVDRPKMGFSVPLDTWLRGPLREWSEHLLDKKHLTEHGIFSAEAVNNVWKEFLDGKGNHQHGIWGLLQVQAWLEHWK